MIRALLDFSLRQQVLVVSLAGVLAVGGLYSFNTLPIDAFPDVTNVQVQVLTDAPGLSPVEVERFITIPLERQMTGLPGLTELRSLSKFALSQITLVFEDRVDIYFARQLVLERLIEARKRLPEGIEPSLAPPTTGLDEVFQYYLDGPGLHPDDPQIYDQELIGMRTAQDWILRPLLRTVPGVIDVNALGGFVKQYQVLVDPAKLRKYDLALHQVFDAVARNNANEGGNVLERYGERAVVRSVGLIRTLKDIEDIVVKEIAGTPVFVRDVAEVRIGHAVRHGAAVLNGEREIVAGIALMLRGANAREVTAGIKQKIDAVHRGRVLPDGLRIVPFYDRSDLVSAAVRTVTDALLEGVILVVAVLLVFLGNLRTALVVVATLIITPLVTFIIMERIGLSANLMSLGGLAIAIGMMVDSFVVMVENIYRHVAERGPETDKRAVVLAAALEVGRPMVFGILIVAAVFLPILTLEGMEGKMFAPLAYTIVIALLVSLVLSLTFSPVFCALALAPRRERDTLLVRWIKRVYLPALGWSLKRKGAVLACTSILLVGTLGLVPFVGTEFIPIMDEGAILPQTIRLPRLSLAESIEVERQVHRALLSLPEVTAVIGKIGRSEIANAPEEHNESEPIVALTPRDTWISASTKPELVEAIRRRLAEIPGIAVLMSQPIQERVDELISGIKTEAAIKVFGDDIETLKTLADRIAVVMNTVDGVKDLKVEQVSGQLYLTVDIDRREIARRGINVEDIQGLVRTAIGGEPATYVLEGERRFQLILRFPESFRNSVKAIGDILIKDPSGALFPLSDLAAIEMREGPVRISREHARRRIYIGFNVAGRDIGGVVKEGQRKLAESVTLPQGYTITWGGAFENMERANARLRIIVPVTLGLVFVLLFSSFVSVRYALLMVMNLPLSLIGGVWALKLTGQYFSVPASVGFITLLGVAVTDGTVMVTLIDSLRREGYARDKAIMTGCLWRVRPVVMTATMSLLGLLPLGLAQGLGGEVQRPLATVVIGGLLTSTVSTLILLPTLYEWFESRRRTSAWPAEDRGSVSDELSVPLNEEVTR
ncbi:efflux RND transporter permease subunit [Candidatus Nitrospira bockiana]